MTPREFLNIAVKPNLAEAAARPGDVRLALNAVHAVDALAAHIASATLGSHAIDFDLKYRNLLAAAYPDFRALRDLAKPTRHVRLSRGGTRAGNADQGLIQGFGFGFATGFAQDAFGVSDAVVVRTAAGSLDSVVVIAQNALAILEAEMALYGL